MLGSAGFAFLIGEGDVTLSVCERRVDEPHLPDDNLALAGDVRGDEGGEAVLRKASIVLGLFVT